MAILTLTVKATYFIVHYLMLTTTHTTNHYVVRFIDLYDS